MTSFVTNIIEIREKIKTFIGQYERYVFILLRFAIALCTLLCLRSILGSDNTLNSTPVLLILALICGLLSINFTVIACAFFTVAELYTISMDIALATALLFVLMFCIYFSMTPSEGPVLLLMALCTAVGLPFLVPVCAGLLRRVTAAVPVACGVFMYYILRIMGSASLKMTAESAEVSVLTLVVNQVAANKEMFVVMGIAVICVCMVYCIRRLPIAYSWGIAILVGMLWQIFVTFAANSYFALHLSIGKIFAGFFIAAALELLLWFFVFHVDYKRTEYVQFEDAEYYYYVKAVPKVTVTPGEKIVKNIRTGRTITDEEVASITGRESGGEDAVD